MHTPDFNHLTYSSNCFLSASGRSPLSHSYGPRRHNFRSGFPLACLTVTQRRSRLHASWSDLWSNESNVFFNTNSRVSRSGHSNKLSSIVREFTVERADAACGEWYFGSDEWISSLDPRILRKGMIVSDGCGCTGAISTMSIFRWGRELRNLNQLASLFADAAITSRKVIFSVERSDHTAMGKSGPNEERLMDVEL